MPASSMDGQRSWKFTSGGDTIKLEGTDFWVNPQGELTGENQDLVPKVTLNEVWEHADFSVSEGRPRRKYVEDRVAEIRDMLGKQGTLVLDEGETEEETFVSITLLGFSPRQSGNDLLEYDLEFGYPTASTGAGGGGVMLASRLEFGTESDADLLVIDSKNMILELADDGDKTQFKEIFRAAPVRVQGAVPLKVINVLGLIDRNVPSGWAAYADTNDGADYRANKLLDPSSAKYWRSTNTALPHWVKLYRGDFPLFKPARVGIVPKTVLNAPKDFVIEGSDNDSTWTTILTVTGASGWVTLTEKTFDVTSLNYRYIRITASALMGGGNQMDLKAVNLYPHSASVSDDYHSENHGKRFNVEDRLRMLNWYQKGRERQLRINNDALLAVGQPTVHLRDVQVVDVEGLETPAFSLTFVYGYGS